MDGAEGVEGDGPGDVGVVGDKLYGRPNFWFAGRKWTGPALVRLPMHRKVAVQIQPFQRRRHFYQGAIIVANTPLRQQPVIVTTGQIIRLARDEQTRMIGMGLPGAVRVFEPHLQDTAVAINILHVQPIQLILAGIRPGAAADKLGVVGQRPLRAIRIEPGHDVKDPAVQQVAQPGVTVITAKQLMNQVESGGRG